MIAVTQKRYWLLFIQHIQVSQDITVHCVKIYIKSDKSMRVYNRTSKSIQVLCLWHLHK